jgi:hypothetical protein
VQTTGDEGRKQYAGPEHQAVHFFGYAHCSHSGLSPWVLQTDRNLTAFPRACQPLSI